MTQPKRLPNHVQFLISEIDLEAGEIQRLMTPLRKRQALQLRDYETLAALVENSALRIQRALTQIKIEKPASAAPSQPRPSVPESLEDTRDYLHQ